MRFLFATLLLH